MKELEENLREEWIKISAVDIQNLINSMPRRVAIEIAAKVDTQNIILQELILSYLSFLV